MSRPLPPGTARACVVSGGVTTHYDVAGRGEPVVILTLDPARPPAHPAAVARDRRVIAPDLSPGSPGRLAATLDFPGWLAAFLEALGLHDVTLLADASLAQHLARFAELHPDRLARLDVLDRPAED